MQDTTTEKHAAHEHSVPPPSDVPKLSTALLLLFLMCVPFFMLYMANQYADPMAQSKTSQANTIAPSLPEAYNTMILGDTREEARNVVGRAPNFSFKATDGSGDDGDEWHDDANNELNVFTLNGRVVKICLVPSGRLQDTEIKQ